MNSHPFEKFQLSKSILRAVTEEGYQEPTPVQVATIPDVLAGRDLMATAQTGTGKTAAFALPMLERLQNRLSDKNGSGRPLRALVLTPTRELALQVETSFRVYGKYLSLRSAVVLGGVSMGSQLTALRKQPDILVATPGRLLDLMKQKQVRLDRIEILVLDEADRMLDMGFIQDVRKIVSHIPARRQTLLFSATMSSEIVGLAGDMLNDPVRVETTRPSSVSQNVDQKVLFVDHADKGALLADILKSKNLSRVEQESERQAAGAGGIRPGKHHGSGCHGYHGSRNRRRRDFPRY
jgi:ATP-dependent RNA helicase RhlE